MTSRETHALTFLVATVLSVTFTLSALRSTWGSYQIDLLGWWSIVSALLNVVLAGFSLWQYFEAEGQKKRGKSQVKIWMQNAKGIVNALGIIKTVEHTNISDVCNTVAIVEASASAMYQSLYEERVVNEERYQASEEMKAELMNAQEMRDLKARASSEGYNSISSSYLQLDTLRTKSKPIRKKN